MVRRICLAWSLGFLACSGSARPWKSGSDGSAAPVRESPKRVVIAPSDFDGDGHLDNVDRCPNQPEDSDGVQDDDGCPDLDDDGDGIPDRDDKCPREPEDKNGFEDTDGCPDQSGLDKQRAADADRQRKADEGKRKADEDKRKTEAASRFKQGKAFHDAGGYDEAIVEYEAAYQLAPAAGLLYNLGQVYRLRNKPGDAAKALDLYKRYVAAEPNGKAADDARAWIAKLTIQLKSK